MYNYIGALKYLDNFKLEWFMTLSIIPNLRFTGTNTDFNQYRSKENVHGFISKPSLQSSFTKQICLEYIVLNHKTCFSVNFPNKR